MSGYPTPAVKVSLDGKDLTDRVWPLLEGLSVTSCRTDEADQLDLVIIDPDGKLALPRRGVTLNVQIGWQDTGLSDLGTFTVDEVEHAGPPDRITITARSVAVSTAMRELKDRSWHQVQLHDIIGALAGAHGLSYSVAPALANLAVDHLDQTRESDLHLLTRLGKRYDAVATVKAGKLLFMPIGAGKSASGVTLPAMTIQRRDGDSHRFHQADRDSYTGVRAYWYSPNSAKRHSVLAGHTSKPGEQGTSVKVLRTTYATEDDAVDAAKSELQRIARGVATLEHTLAQGRADLYPELPVKAVGFRPEIDQVDWLIAKITHRLDQGGFVTLLELETRTSAAQASDEGTSA